MVTRGPPYRARQRDFSFARPMMLSVISGVDPSRWQLLGVVRVARNR